MFKEIDSEAISQIIQETKSIKKENEKLKIDIDDIQKEINVIKDYEIEISTTIIEKEQKIKELREEYQKVIENLTLKKQKLETKAAKIKEKIKNYDIKALQLFTQGSTSTRTSLLPIYKRALILFDLDDNYDTTQLRAATKRLIIKFNNYGYSEDETQDIFEQICEANEILALRLTQKQKNE